MKTIGLIGGMSWQSTVHYYQWINQGISDKLGGLHSAQILLHSLDFDRIEKLQADLQWQQAGDILIDSARKLELAGADGLMICTNTMHIVAEQVADSVNIPLLHLADATAQKVVEQNIQTIGLLGTAFTMEQGFYKDRLLQAGLKVVVPDAEARRIVHQIIYQELCLGEVKDSSRVQYLKIMNQFVAQGAEGIILGCTEIAMLVKSQHTNVALFDTTSIHAEAAVEWMLQD